MSRTPRVLILTLDGAEHSIVTRWAAAGRLPNLQALIERSSAALVENPHGISGATWPSLNTGRGPGRHGYYYYSQLVPGTYRTHLLSRNDVHGAAFWETLAAAGKRVVVLDVPKTCPIKDFNGIVVSDWGNHDGDIFDGCQTWPPSLAGELTRRFGPDPFKGRGFGIRGPRDWQSFIDGLELNIRRKTDMFRAMMSEQDWDLLYANWDDAHWAGHFGWRQHDPQHPHHDPELAATLGNPMDRVLRAIDDSVGELLEQAGPETQVLFLCSHGMGPGYRTADTLDPILRRLESRPTTARNETYSLLRQAWDALPNRTHRPLAWFKDIVRESILAKDRARRRWFTLPVNHDGGLVRLNVVGREPQGIIQAGAEYEATLDYLSRELRAIVDLDTGEPVVGEVYRVHALCPGEYQHRLPDLALRWNSSRPARRIGSPSIGEFSEQLSATRTGEHRPTGMLFSSAGQAGVAAAMRAQDFAPTVARLLGVTLADVDGSVVSELISAHAR